MCALVTGVQTCALPISAAAHGLDALVAQAEHLAGLGFGGDADLGLTVERWHAHGVAERGLRNADRAFAVQVVPVAHEDPLRAHAHPDVQVHRPRDRRAGLALAGSAGATSEERRVGKEYDMTWKSR